MPTLALLNLPPVYLARDLPSGLGQREVAAGRWRRVRRGAYTPTPIGESWEIAQQLMLAHAEAVRRQLRCGFVFAGQSAALLRGWSLWVTPTQTHVLHRTRRRAGLPSDVRWSIARLDDDDVETIGGVRMTSADRTLLDCARLLHPRDALVVVDSGFRALIAPTRAGRAHAEHEAQALRAKLLDRLDEPWARPGRVQARAVIEHAEPFAESAPESVVRWIAVSRGLPRPTLQQQVQTEAGTFYTDLAFHWAAGRRAWTTHVEYDGAAKYGATSETAAAAVLAEKSREDAIREVSGAVIRFVRGDLSDEDKVLTRITAGLPVSLTGGWRPVPGLFLPRHGSQAITTRPTAPYGRPSHAE